MKKLIITILLLITALSSAQRQQEQTTIVTEDVTVDIEQIVNYKDYKIDYVTVKTEEKQKQTVKYYQIETIEYYDNYREVYINELPVYDQNYETLDDIESYNYRMDFYKKEKLKNK